MNPSKYLQIALEAKLKALGYDTFGFDAFPRVEVDNVTLEQGMEKGGQNYLMTFTLDIITRGSSQMESLNMLESIRDNIEPLSVENYHVDGLFPEACEQIIEETETDMIFRQVQRYRIYLTTKN